MGWLRSEIPVDDFPRMGYSLPAGVRGPWRLVGVVPGVFVFSVSGRVHMKYMKLLSLSSRGSRYHLSVAITLVTIIPLLCLAFVAWTQLWLTDTYSVWIPVLVSGLASVLAIAGYTLLRKYPRNIVKLRGYLESIVAGELPDRVDLDDPEDDIGAIEHYLNSVIEQLRGKLRNLEEQLAISERQQATIRAQAEELGEAERQRIVIESLGAACHHIGQPATVLRVYLNMLREDPDSPEAAEQLDKCNEAIDAIADVLAKLRQVSEYRPVPYNTYTPDATDGKLRIIDIDQRESARGAPS